MLALPWMGRLWVMVSTLALQSDTLPRTLESMPARWFSCSISEALRPTVSWLGSRILSLYL